MSKVTTYSALAAISESISTSRNADQAKAIFHDHVMNSYIRESDKDLIISKLTPLKDLVKIQTYFYNSLLHFEKLGVN